MCEVCKEAVQMRRDAAAKLLEACSGREAMRKRLKLVYPPQPVPDDLQELAMRIGGQS